MDRSSISQAFFLRALTRFGLFFLVVFLTAVPLSAAVTMPSIFGDAMVLQRDKPIPVWGRADAAESVTVRINGSESRTVANDKGFWKVQLPAMAAGGPYELVVEATNTLTFGNVMVGEVWVCSGQSNMEWPVSRTDNHEKVIENCADRAIRLFDVPRTPAGQRRIDVNASWKPCAPDTLANFSAVAYFFGCELRRELDVAVGLINTSWGGTRIEPWTPPEGFRSVENCAPIARQIDAANLGYRNAVSRALDPLEAWIGTARAAIAAGTGLPTPPALPVHPLQSHSKPTGLYNGMVHPIVPYAIRGAIWYQGESNRVDGMAYHHKMKALINGWRTVWNQGDFPFYFVQLAPFKYRTEDPSELPRLWEAQAATLSVPHTGMAVTVDIGNIKDIHPRNKLDVGRRLALWALAHDYGKKDIVFSGPLYKSMACEGGKIRLEFDHAASGLASRDGKPLSWFEVAGDDQRFVKARAEVDGSTLIVWSDAVRAPAAVRFGWHQEAEPNLINKNGLPASPFRTDQW